MRKHRGVLLASDLGFLFCLMVEKLSISEAQGRGQGRKTNIFMTTGQDGPIWKIDKRTHEKLLFHLYVFQG